MNLTVPSDLAERLKAKVASGEYASESDVIRAGLEALEHRDEDLEAWLRREVVPSYDEFLAAPETGIPAEQVFGEAEARYRARKLRESK